MRNTFRSGSRATSALRAGIALAAALSLGMISIAAAFPGVNASAQADMDSAASYTWVLESPNQFRAQSAPDETETAQEVTQLLEMAGERDDAALTQIAYWDSGAPSYRWNQIALDTMRSRGIPGPVAFRHLALIHAAINDATVAAFDGKQAFNRPRPSAFDPSLTTVIATPSSPSFPSEYGATAGAASAVLGWLFPDSAQEFEAMALEAVTSRQLAGVEYPSDGTAGLDLGRQVADLVIARGNADGFSAAWTGTVPTEPGHWTGENPALPAAGSWQPWVLESGDQFRPAPPFAYDSAELAAEMAELREFERTPVTNAAAMFWEFGAGGRHIQFYWNDMASQLILASEWGNDPVLAAQAYALTNIAAYDAVVGCWDAKYTYWAMRPFQLDSEFTPLFSTPGHPSYPSAHSCLSGAAAGVLAELFPADRERLMSTLTEIGEARIWGGLHFRSDVVAGLELGENVAAAVVDRALHNSAQ